MPVDDLIKLSGRESSVLTYLATYRSNTGIDARYRWIATDFTPSARDVAEFVLGFKRDYDPAVVAKGQDIMYKVDNGINI